MALIVTDHSEKIVTNPPSQKKKQHPFKVHRQAQYIYNIATYQMKTFLGLDDLKLLDWTSLPHTEAYRCRARKRKTAQYHVITWKV